MDGASLYSTTIALAVVCALAVGALRALGRRGRGAGRCMRVHARLGLEPRRSLALVEAAGRFFLVGVGDGAPTLLAELDAAETRAELAAPPAAGASPSLGGAFAAALKRVLGGTHEAR